MSRCAICSSLDDVGTDDRTAQELCGSCRRLSLRELGRRLVWRATTDLGADDHTHAARVRAGARLTDAMRRAVLALCVLLLSACSAVQLPTAGNVLAVTCCLLLLTVALLAAFERICAALNLSD